MFPCTLTVYTAFGRTTVENVREDSIERKGLRLIAEGGKDGMTLFTFYFPIGYSTRLD